MEKGGKTVPQYKKAQSEKWHMSERRVANAKAHGHGIS